MNQFNYRKGLLVALMAIGGLSSANALTSPTASDSPLLQNVSQQITTDTNTVDLSSAFDVNAGTKLIDVTPLTSHSACDVISIKKAKGEFTLASNVAANCQYEFTIKDIEKNKATAYAQVVINADDASAHQLPMTSAKSNVGECLDFDLSQSLDTTRYQLKDIANATLGTTSVTNNTFTYCAQSAGAAVVNYTVTDTDDGHLLAGTVAVANSATRNPSIAAQDYAGPTVLPNASISIDVCPSESNSALSNTCHLTNADLLDVRVANASVTNINGTQFTFSASQEGWYDVAYTANSNSDYASGVVRIKVESIVADAIAQPVMVDEHSVYTAPWRVEQAQQQGVVFADSKTENTNNGVFDMALFNFAQAQSVCANQGMSLPTKVQFNALTDAYPNIQASAGWPVLKPYWMQSGKVKAFDLTKQKPQIVSAEDSYNVTCFYAGSLSALQAAQNDSAISAQSNDTDAVTSSQDVSVTLTNSNGNALSDQVVYFYSDSSDVAFENATTSTDANGQASTSATATASHAVYANYLSQTQQLVVPFSESVKIVDFILSPNPLTIYQGDTVDALTATITFSDDTSMELAGNEVFWQPGNDKISIDKVGKITGEKPGFSSIKGEYKLNNQVVNASVTVIVLERITVESMSVTPATTTLDIGKTGKLVAKVTLSDATTYNSNDNPELFTWTSHKPSVVSVGTNTGKLTALAEGDDVKVEATFELNELTQSAHATVTVNTGVVELSSISVEQDRGTDTALIDTDNNDYFKATAHYTDGTSKLITQDANNNWSSSDTSIAKVSNKHNAWSGHVVAGTTAGVAAIKATYTEDGITKSGSKNFTVTAPVVELSSVTVEQDRGTDTAPLNTDNGDYYKATAHYSDGTSKLITQDANNDWSSSNKWRAKVTNTHNSFSGHIVAGELIGVAEIKATYTEDGITKSGSKNFTVTAPVVELSSVTVEQGRGTDTAPLNTDNGDYYKATAHYSDGTSKLITQDANNNWSSSDTSIAKVSNKHNAWSGHVVAGTTAGVVAIKATYTEDGITKSGSKNFSTTAAPVTISELVVGVSNGITTAEADSSDVGKYTATLKYSDGSTKVVTSNKNTEWSSNKTSIATVDNKHNAYSGWVHAKGTAGTAAITATYTEDGQKYSGNKDFSVTEEEVVLPSKNLVSVSMSTYFRTNTQLGVTGGTAYFDDGSTLWLNDYGTLTASGALVHTPTEINKPQFRKVGSGSGTGTVKLSFTYNGVTKSMTKKYSVPSDRQWSTVITEISSSQGN